MISTNRLFSFCALILFFLLMHNYYNLYTSKIFFDGEGGGLTSILLNFSIKNNLDYPMAKIYEYAGFNTKALHPPLYYIISGLTTNFFKINANVFLTVNFIVCFFSFFLVSYVFIFNKENKGVLFFLFFILIFLQETFYQTLTVVRPEIFLGFLNTIIFFILIKTKDSDNMNYFFLGFFSGLSVSTHWIGISSVLSTTFIIIFLNIFYFKLSFFNLFKNLFFLFIGFILLLAIWYFYYEVDLIYLILLALNSNILFLEIIDHNIIDNFIMKIIKSEGGKILLFGFFSNLIFMSFKKSKDKNEVIGVLFIALYFLFFIFMGNKELRYFSNIIFIAVPISCLGFFKLIQFLSEQIPQFAKFEKLSILLISFTLLFKSPNFNYFLLQNSNSNEIFDLVKEKLSTINKNNILVGSSTYPYAHDLKYLSTYNIIWSLYGPKYYEGNNIIMEGIDNYNLKYKIIREEAFKTPTPILKKTLKDLKVDYLFLADHCHFYQCLFKQHEVWKEDYNKDSSFIRLKNLNTPKHLEIYMPRVLSLYSNKKIEEKSKSKNYCDNGVILLSYDKVSEISFKEWENLNFKKKSEALSLLFLKTNILNNLNESQIKKLSNEYVDVLINNEKFIQNTRNFYFRDNLLLSEVFELSLSEKENRKKLSIKQC